MTFNIHTITIYLQYITTKRKADDMQQVTSDIMTLEVHIELGVKTGKWLPTNTLLKNREKNGKTCPTFRYRCK